MERAGIAGCPAPASASRHREEETDRLAFNLPCDIKNIARVETDIEGLGAIVGIQLFGRGSRVGAVGLQRDRAERMESLIAWERSVEIEETRSTASAKPPFATVNTFWLPRGMTRS